MFELELTQQVHAQEQEECDPQHDEHLTVENVPPVGEIGHREELERQGELDKTEHHLDSVHPRARLGRALEPAGEDGEEAERNGQRESKAKHAYGRAEHRARAYGLDEQGAYDGTGA